MAELRCEQQRTIYMVTYSRANTAIFRTRLSFANAVLEAWSVARVRVQHWVCSIEAHAETDTEVDTMNRYHYHMALKLTKKARWLQVRNYLDRKYGIKVHFSDTHTTYYSAYCYVTKDDKSACHSPNHPDLGTQPKTERAIATRKRNAALSGQRGKKRDGGRNNCPFTTSPRSYKRKKCRNEWSWSL